MKSLLTTLFLAASLTSFGQVKQNAVIIGGTLTPEVKDGLFASYLSTGPNQLALVAGQGFTSVYYAVYSAQGQLLRSGKFTEKSAGAFQVIDLGMSAEGCKPVISDKPVLVTSKAANNG